MSSATMTDRESDTAPERVRIGHDRTDLSPSLAVVEAIADLTGIDSVELADETGIVLYDYVDPDALDALVASSVETRVDISLTVAGYDVRVDESEVVARRSAE